MHFQCIRTTPKYRAESGSGFVFNLRQLRKLLRGGPEDHGPCYTGFSSVFSPLKLPFQLPLAGGTGILPVLPFSLRVWERGQGSATPGPLSQILFA
jgi:hypothetical protein